jgi:hypothetical protein
MADEAGFDSQQSQRGRPASRAHPTPYPVSANSWRSGSECDHPFLPSTDVMNAWSCTSTTHTNSWCDNYRYNFNVTFPARVKKAVTHIERTIHWGWLRWENRVLKAGGSRKLHNEELLDLCSSPSIIRIIKSRSWSCSTNGEKRNAYRLLVGKPEGKMPLGRQRRKWVDNIRMDLGEVG